MDDASAIELTPEIKTDWNNFQTHLNGDYPTTGALNEFNGKNPKSQLTESHIPAALNYISSIKQNPDVVGLTPAYRNGNNMRFPVTADGKHPDLGNNPMAIPKPDYNNPQSRMQYAQQFTKKYGPLMQGRGDTALRINETPDEGTDSVKNLTIKAAKPLGLDPATFYSSAMEEGMSGLFKDKNGESDFSGDKDYPTDGYTNFGLDDFVDKVPALIKKGYLSPEFKNQYVPKKQTNEQGREVNSANFKSPDAALQAKAAVVKDFQDQTEDYAKKNNIPLTEKQKQFFTLAAYNGGVGNMRKMMAEYNKKGALKDDSFIANPETGSYKTIHTNVGRRILMAQALKSEGLF